MIQISLVLCTKNPRKDEVFVFICDVKCPVINPTMENIGKNTRTPSIYKKLRSFKWNKLLYLWRKWPTKIHYYYGALLMNAHQKWKFVNEPQRSDRVSDWIKAENDENEYLTASQVKWKMKNNYAKHYHLCTVMVKRMTPKTTTTPTNPLTRVAQLKGVRTNILSYLHAKETITKRRSFLCFKKISLTW